MMYGNSMEFDFLDGLNTAAMNTATSASVAMKNDKIYTAEELNEVKRAREFILGGNSEFTIKNLDNGRVFKYKVRRNKSNENMYFIKCYRNGEWVYMGFIAPSKENPADFVFIRGKAGNGKFNDPEIKGIMYAIKKGDNPLPRPMILMHHGKCACCGKKLDDPESVARGFGPVCWDNLGKAKLKGVA